MISFNKQAGFSLVETILYLAIVGVLLTAAVSLHLTLGGTADKLTSNILVSKNRRVALNSIDYLVKNSDGILRDLNSACSSLGATPPILSLYFSDDTYLPGTCVKNGGAVRISVLDKKISLTCYPNIGVNGSYQACDTSVYPAENIYYLSSSDIAVLDSALSFSTSTATSTANNFISVTTKLDVSALYNEQVSLSATSTATSTVVLKNEESRGLISWWKLDGGLGTDSQGSNDLTLYNSPTSVTGVVNASTNALDFDGTNDYCAASDDTSLNFNNSFTIAAWVEEDTTASLSPIVSKINQEVFKGYGFYLNGGYPALRICDSTFCVNYSSTELLSNNITYHVAASYDLENDEIKLYTYKEGGVGQSTTTKNLLLTLVNYSGDLLLSTSTASSAFDGIIDDVRIYNRVLSAEEIWALQSQGTIAN